MQTDPRDAQIAALREALTRAKIYIPRCVNRDCTERACARANALLSEIDAALAAAPAAKREPEQ